MKQIAKFILLISILPIIVSCNLRPCVDCGGVSFVENYLENIQRNGIFFVKGEALEVYRYGRNIRVIEDLKGNFGNTSFFIWGMEMGTGRHCTTEPNKVDFITRYNVGDTLIVIFERARRRFRGDLENNSHFTTIACSHSVLKFFNDSVTGAIHYPWYWQTMSWLELQEELSRQLQKNY